ncbi:hypothetical protein Hamer_G014640 [Homarus americanus]|uniref:Uncharacterized protein n=1 Tax=Homarus americanus TaxID=6706 RepID=A0A8J5TJV4_HOMAM|nr:hypothetical protein Hamer_G014640 [Homarus americanus]
MDDIPAVSIMNNFRPSPRLTETNAHQDSGRQHPPATLKTCAFLSGNVNWIVRVAVLRFVYLRQDIDVTGMRHHLKTCPQCSVVPLRHCLLMTGHYHLSRQSIKLTKSSGK